MTLEQMQADIESLRQQQDRQRRNWARWGLVSFGIALVLWIAIGIGMAKTGADPSPPMLFIMLTFVFLGLVFSSVGRPNTFRFWPRRK
jgi:hypothetical protein